MLLATTVAHTRAPCVATFHGIPDVAAGQWIGTGPVAERRRGIRSRLEAFTRLAADGLLARQAAAVVAPSASIGRFLETRLRVPAARVRVIPNGVADTPARPLTGPVEVFTSVGSFAALKAMPALVTAFADVAATRPALRLRLVGDGDERAGTEAAAFRHGVADRVEFTGYRADVEAQLAKAQAFVLPSLNENMPLALLEAMMAGMPCVASEVGGIPEVLGADRGILVAPGDHTGLVAAMARLADDADLAATLGAAAAAHAHRELTIGRCADRHVELWQELSR